MKNVCAAAAVTHGIDVSHYQRHVDWHGQQTIGVKFAYVKASEALHLTDDMFVNHWYGAKNAGLLRGAYHFFHPKRDPVQQARHFASILQNYGMGELPCAMDWEVTDGVPNSLDIVSGVAFLKELEKIVGHTPVIYTGPYFFQALGTGTQGLDRHPLWIAHAKAHCPLVPFPWTAWTFWQMDSNGGLDHDLFNGDLDQLKNFAVKP